MSLALNIVSNNVQGYGPSESSSLPCLGVSGRAVSVSSCPRSDFKTLQVKTISLKCSVKPVSFVCKASSGGYRRNPDFSRQIRHGSSRNRNRINEERDSSENVDESEFLSTKNGPLLSLSNSPKSHATAAPGPREREIVELFRKVQAQLRERSAIKEQKKFEAVKGENKESETVDSLLKLLRKHSVEQGKRKVNGGGASASEFSFDRPKQRAQPDEDKGRTFFNPNSIVREEPQETDRPSFSRPVSDFRRRSPIPRVRYEPIVSPLDLDGKTSKTHSEPDPDPDLDPEMDLVSGLELEQEEDREVQKREFNPGADFVDGSLSEVEFLDDEDDKYNEKDAEKQQTEMKDLNAMKLAELRALAKARGMKGFSKLKKSELVGLLSEDSL